MLKLISLYLLLFIAVVGLQLLAVPAIILYITTTAILVLILYVTLKPILFEKDYLKVLEFLKKSKNPSYQFLYLYFEKRYDEAEQYIPRVKPKKVQDFHRIAILSTKNKFKEAKELALSLKDSEDKFFYLCLIALELKDKKMLEEYRPKLKRALNKQYLTIYELYYNGKKKEAFEYINRRISRTKGFQLLMDVQLKNELMTKK